MMRMPALALLLLGVPLLQEPSAPLKWAVKLDSRFSLRFNYSEQRRTDVVQKGVGTIGATVKTSNSMSEKREVEAELSYREVPGREWSLSTDLKKASWTYTTDESEVTLTFNEGKEPQTRVIVKEKDKLRIPQAKADADLRAEHMKRLVTGDYDFTADRVSGKVLILRAGAVDLGFALFGRAFIQPPCPSEPVTAGQMWKDAISSELPGFQEAGVADLPLKVATLNEKAVTVKGSVNVPLAKPPNPGDALNGTFSLEREFVFSRDGYVQSSREEFSLKKNLNSKTAFFGGNTVRDEITTASYKQSLTLKPRK